jgi:hypothetical protein
MSNPKGWLAQPALTTNMVIDIKNKKVLELSYF